MIIELVGLPASGKTTLAEQMVSAIPGLQSKRTAFKNSLLKIASKTHTIREYRKPITAGVRSLATDSRPWSQKLDAVRWLLSTLDSFTKYGRQPNSIVLAEGPIQRGVLLFFDARKARWDEKHLSCYLCSAPKSDLVIYLDVDPGLAVKRYKLRSKAEVGPLSRFESSPIDLLTQFETISEVLARTVAETQTAGTRIVRATSIDEGIAGARRVICAA